MATETEQQHTAVAPPTGRAPTSPPPAYAPCPTCAAPLDDDQRYCLNCGRRVGPERGDLIAALPGRGRPAEDAIVVASAPPSRPAGPGLWTPAGAGALAALLALGLLAGALLWGSDEPRDIVVNVPRQEAPRVDVTVPAQGGAAAVPVEFSSDWPGEDGWTVQLQALPKDGTEPTAVAAAKTEATTKGAEDVGALDSDEYGSLDPAEYVIYSGVYKTKKAARKDLSALRKDFPDARVVKVAAAGGATPKVEKDADKASKSDLEDLNNAAGDDFVKKSKKLKDKTATGGKAPKTDDKAPGGGSGGGEVLE